MKSWQNVGLFLASIAAFFLACGHQRAALAGGASSVEQVMSTSEGKAALARAGISPEKFQTMLASLSDEQKETLEGMVRDMTPSSVLTARMVALGYTKAEVDERLAVLTEDELVALAGNPEAMDAGGSAGLAWAVVAIVVVFVAILVAWYYVAVEKPEAQPAPAPVEPAPVQ